MPVYSDRQKLKIIKDGVLDIDKIIDLNFYNKFNQNTYNGKLCVITTEILNLVHYDDVEINLKNNTTNYQFYVKCITLNTVVFDAKENGEYKYTDDIYFEDLTDDALDLIYNIIDEVEWYLNKKRQKVY